MYFGYFIEINREMNFNINKFFNLQHVNLGENQLHMSNGHPRGESKHCRTCLGNPQFSGLGKQTIISKNGVFV